MDQKIESLIFDMKELIADLESEVIRLTEENSRLKDQINEIEKDKKL